MMSSSLYDTRLLLKSKLYVERAVWTKKGFVPLCAICGKPSKNNEALQMHETFITRGDVSGNKDLTVLSMTRYNCVLVDAACHIDANSVNGKKLCASNILTFEDPNEVINWLKSMVSYTRGTVAQEAIRLVKEVMNEM